MNTTYAHARHLAYKKHVFAFPYPVLHVLGLFGKVFFV